MGEGLGHGRALQRQPAMAGNPLSRHGVEFTDPEGYGVAVGALDITRPVQNAGHRHHTAHGPLASGQGGNAGVGDAVLADNDGAVRSDMG